MRIELPTPTWAETQHAQDDAHTLTLPALSPALPHPLLGALAAVDSPMVRVEVPAVAPAALTLTF